MPTLLVVVGAITNGIFNPANSTAMIAMMPKEHRGFASAINHVTFGFGSVFGVALGRFVDVLGLRALYGRESGDIDDRGMPQDSSPRSISPLSRRLS